MELRKTADNEFAIVNMTIDELTAFNNAVAVCNLPDKRVFSCIKKDMEGFIK